MRRKQQAAIRMLYLKPIPIPLASCFSPPHVCIGLAAWPVGLDDLLGYSDMRVFVVLYFC